jgi:hypothetical protein
VNVATSIWVCAWESPCARAASILIAFVVPDAFACSPFQRVAW